MEPPRRLESRYRVRFDEADAAGLLRPSGFLRYAQDMAWRHSEEAGFGREWYAERAMHWLVRNVDLRITAPVSYGDTLAVSTEVTGWRRVWIRRQAEMRRVRSVGGEADAELVALVVTDWVLLADDGRPARVPAEIARYFSATGTFARSRVTLPDPPAGAPRLATRVRSRDVDPMGHMNNAAYLDAVEDACSLLPGAMTLGRPGSYRIGYLRPALPGSTLEVSCWPTDGGPLACRISDGDGCELSRVLVSRPER